MLSAAYNYGSEAQKIAALPSEGIGIETKRSARGE